MSKQVVVITGAGSGLGKSLACKYAEQGYHVCLLGRTEQKLQRAAEVLNGSHSIYTVDVSNKQHMAAVIQRIVDEHGAIDLLINNAGFGAFDLAENLSEEHTHAMIDVNLKGTIFGTQVVLPHMKQREQGHIINIVSTAGQVGKATESVYCASKFGVKGFTESVALELKGSPVRITAVYMGGMGTEFWDGIFDEDRKSKMMDPDDVADVIVESTKQRKRMNVADITIKNH